MSAAARPITGGFFHAPAIWVKIGRTKKGDDSRIVPNPIHTNQRCNTSHPHTLGRADYAVMTGMKVSTTLPRLALDSM